MSILDSYLKIGDRVAVYDRRGTEYGKLECRGEIVGKSYHNVMMYDVLGDGEKRPIFTIREYRIKRTDVMVPVNEDNNGEEKLKCSLI